MKEDFKYQIMKRIVECDGNKQAAALRIVCTVRHLNRLINDYHFSGKEFFIHGNKGSKPSHSISEDTMTNIINLYKTKYNEANFTHFAELLGIHDDISVSPSTVNTILMAENILSPKATGVTKNRVKKELLGVKSKSSPLTIHDKESIEKSIIEIEDAHPRRPRSAYFGEMIQMDASLHQLYGDAKSQLHIAIDDSTGAIVGVYFDYQEILKGYYNIFYQVFLEYGIPYMFFTDRRTVFEYKQKKIQQQRGYFHTIWLRL